jgi:hypothetical protein
VVTEDAGFAATKTVRLIDDKNWTSVFAMPRTRKFTKGKYVRDPGRHRSVRPQAQRLRSKAFEDTAQPQRIDDVRRT